MVKPDMAAIKKLSVTERIALVEEIWDSISADAASVAVTEEQIAEARRRLAEHDADPGTAIPWEEVKARLHSNQ